MALEGSPDVIELGQAWTAHPERFSNTNDNKSLHNSASPTTEVRFSCNQCPLQDLGLLNLEIFKIHGLDPLPAEVLNTDHQ